MIGLDSVDFQHSILDADASVGRIVASGIVYNRAMLSFRKRTESMLSLLANLIKLSSCNGFSAKEQLEPERFVLLREAEQASC